MNEFLHPHTYFLFQGQCITRQGFILCLCGAVSAPLSWGDLPYHRPLKPGGTSFNIQNPIPHLSQKEKVFLETSRAKECQRGPAGAEESAKEGGRVPVEGSDTHLGPSGREFESPISGQSRQNLRVTIVIRRFCLLLVKPDKNPAWSLGTITYQWDKQAGLRR